VDIPRTSDLKKRLGWAHYYSRQLPQCGTKFSYNNKWLQKEWESHRIQRSLRRCASLRLPPREAFSERFQGAYHRRDMLLDEVGADLSGFEIHLADQLLNHTDIDATIKQVSSKRATESAAGDPFIQSCTLCGRAD
jgi:hypothetical protein